MTNVGVWKGIVVNISKDITSAIKQCDKFKNVAIIRCKHGLRLAKNSGNCQRTIH